MIRGTITLRPVHNGERIWTAGSEPKPGDIVLELSDADAADYADVRRRWEAWKQRLDAVSPDRPAWAK